MARTKLDIIIVGAGIGGLTAATFLAQDGHKVTVLERKSKEYQSRGTGGIALFHNSKTLWKQRGLLDRILDVAETGNINEVFSYKGNLIGEMKVSRPHSFVHREDILQVLLKLVNKHKVNLQFDTTITAIKDEPGRPGVTLANGQQLTANLIIAADGINSFIRRQLYPDIEPQLTTSVVLLVDIPKECMLETQATRRLWEREPFQHSLGPERDIVFWSMRKHNPEVTHLQFCDHAYDESTGWYGVDSRDSPFVTTVNNMTSMRQRWHDFEPRIQHILNSARGYTRWKIAEVPPLPSYSSLHHGFVLLGDSAHAVMPFAGQGANMSVEDAACLATMLRSLESKHDIPQVLRTYNQLRIPRLAGLREIIKLNRESFSAADGSEAQKERNEIIKGKSQEEIDSAKNQPKYGKQDPWTWLVEHDVIAETTHAWNTQHRSKGSDQKL